MLNICIGMDSRQPLAYTVLQNSIIRRASKPVSITPLILSQLPVSRRGLTEFTFSRFLCPWLCGFQGISLFLDADMLVLADIHELAALQDPQYAVQVVKCGQRFEWPSLMLFNNEKCAQLKPEWIDNNLNPPQALMWGEVGFLPSEWNHCVGYDPPREDAKILHFTQGIPCFEETKDSEHAALWMEEFQSCRATVSWRELMGSSVHAERVLKGAR